MASLNLLLPVLILLRFIGASADGNVTMESLTIFDTHEWFENPTVYFRCQHESKVYLPDVVHKDEDYKFVGQESWQPLTTLYGEKCKRCGLYEEDFIKADDVFYEGELCPSDFKASPEGRFVLFKEKQLNASFLCPDCGAVSGNQPRYLVDALSTCYPGLLSCCCLHHEHKEESCGCFLYSSNSRREKLGEMGQSLRLRS
jgi:hypothetical protein